MLQVLIVLGVVLGSCNVCASSFDARLLQMQEDARKPRQKLLNCPEIEKPDDQKAITAFENCVHTYLNWRYGKALPMEPERYKKSPAHLSNFHYYYSHSLNVYCDSMKLAEMHGNWNPLKIFFKPFIPISYANGITLVEKHSKKAANFLRGLFHEMQGLKQATNELEKAKYKLDRENYFEAMVHSLSITLLLGNRSVTDSELSCVTSKHLLGVDSTLSLRVMLYEAMYDEDKKEKFEHSLKKLQIHEFWPDLDKLITAIYYQDEKGISEQYLEYTEEDFAELESPALTPQEIKELKSPDHTNEK
ncbi:MAG: hypothetical protein ACPGXY_06300 [Alphaproteobacteria bacterium]